MKYKKLILLIAVAILNLMLVVTVFALTVNFTANITDASATAPSIPLSNPGLYTTAGSFSLCSTGDVSFDFSATSSINWGHWLYVSTDAIFDWNTDQNIGFTYSSLTPTPLNATVSLPAGNYTIFIQIPNVTVGSGDPSYSVDVTATTFCTSTTNAVVTSITMPPDDRINWQYGDLHAVLYRADDAIDVYCWDGDDSWLGLRADASTASGTGANGCDATFYILSDGSYQFNIHFDGKLYEVICADFECRPPELRYFDPNE